MTTLKQRGLRKMLTLPTLNSGELNTINSNIIFIKLRKLTFNIIVVVCHYTVMLQYKMQIYNYSSEFCLLTN